jgi:hypothetical protein
MTLVESSQRKVSAANDGEEFQEREVPLRLCSQTKTAVRTRHGGDE